MRLPSMLRRLKVVGFPTLGGDDNDDGGGRIRG